MSETSEENAIILGSISQLDSENVHSYGTRGRNIIDIPGSRFETFYIISIHDNGLAKIKLNMVVTGTPGVGKTSYCVLFTQNTGLQSIYISHI